MDCDRIARAYRWIEYLSFGRELERRRFRHIPHVADACHALILGGGDGRFLARLMRQNPRARAEYVDCSPRMLSLARSRAGGDRVSYRLSDARALPLAPESFDLIVTNFFLDCFDEADAAEVGTGGPRSLPSRPVAGCGIPARSVGWVSSTRPIPVLPGDDRSQNPPAGESSNAACASWLPLGARRAVVVRMADIGAMAARPGCACIRARLQAVPLGRLPAEGLAPAGPSASRNSGT